MEAFNFSRMKKLVLTFHRFSGDAHIEKEDFRKIFQTTLTGEYMDFVCEQYEGNTVNWKELCMGISLHPLYLVPGSHHELSKQILDSQKVHEKKKKGSKERSAHFLLEKDTFMEVKLWYENYQVKHPRMGYKQLKEIIWMIMSDKKTENLDLFELSCFFCDDFNPQKSMLNFFRVFGSGQENPSVLPTELVDFLVVKKRNQSKLKLLSILEKKYGMYDRVKFYDFLESDLGKELFQQHVKYFTKKRVDDESDMKFRFVRSDPRNDMYQLKSPPLFKNLYSCGYTSAYCIHVISKLLEEDPEMSVEELQKRLVDEKVSVRTHEFENLLIQNLFDIASGDRESYSMEMIIGSINRHNPSFSKSLLSDRDLLRHAIPFKIKKLDSELNDKEYPLSDSGIKKITGFKNFFKDLLKKVETEEEGEEEEKEEIKLTKDQVVEIRKDVWKSYVQKRVTVRELRNFVCQDPLTEGLELYEFLCHPRSKLRLSELGMKLLVCYVTFNFTRTDLMTLYDFELMFDFKKELIMKIGHFFSIEKELDVLMERAIVEVVFGLRPFLVLNALNSLDTEHWIGIFVRKRSTGGVDKLELISSDSFNGRFPVGEIIPSKFNKKTSKKLTTSNIKKKFLEPTIEGFSAFKIYFSESQKDVTILRKKERFLSELKETGALKGDFEKNLAKILGVLKGKKEEFSREERLFLYGFFKKWKLFMKKGSIKNIKTLVEENLELKKMNEELFKKIEMLEKENEALKNTK